MTQEPLLSFRVTDGVAVVCLNASELTPSVGEALDGTLSQVLAGGGRAMFLLDMSRLTFLGSIGLGVLMVFLKRVRSGGGDIVLADLKGVCRDVVRVCGLEKIFKIYDSVPAALKALKTRTQT